MGRGWPPATDNYGRVVENLFHQQAQPVLSLVWLPSRGKETGLSLMAGAEGGSWTLRHSQAEERVYSWNSSSRSGGVELRAGQPARQQEVAIPASLAQQLVQVWTQALQQAVPAHTAAGVQEGSLLSLVIQDVRFSGRAPDCGPTAAMLEQAALMVEASTEKETKRERRWLQLQASLDKLQASLADNNG
jgi:hypothetical protein